METRETEANRQSMSDSISFLSEQFNIYYQRARSSHDSKNFDAAKRNYLLAAETLLKIAKQSTPQLAKAQMQRAKRLMDIADGVPLSPKKRVSSSSEEKGEEEGSTFKPVALPPIRFSDIAGLDDVKHTITVRMLNPLKYPEKYAAYGKKTGGGVLLFGPPGTGKTMIARAIAGEVGAKFYVIKGSDIVSKWVGESEKNISALFSEVSGDESSIIFIDEMDGLFGRRGVDTHNDKRVGEFLQQIDGFASKNPKLLLLGATNRPWDIDSAVTRSGRFSERIYVPLPDKPARKFLLSKHLKDIPGGKELNFDKYASLTVGYSGADVAELCDRAKEGPLLRSLSSSSDALPPVTDGDIDNALKMVPPTVSADEIAQFEKFCQQERIMYTPSVQRTDNVDDDAAVTDTAPYTPPADVAPPADEPIEEAPTAPAPSPSASDRIEMLDDFLGQDKLVEELKYMIAGAKKRGATLDHIMLYGGPGLGKTTVSAIIAREMGANFHEIYGTTANIDTLTNILKDINAGDVLLADEIQEWNGDVQQHIYTVLEEGKLNYITGSGQNRRAVTKEMPPFTLIAATTDPGKLKPAFRARLVELKLQPYSTDAIAKIIEATTAKMGLPIAENHALDLAKRCHGTPRNAIKHCRRLRDRALAAGQAVISEDILTNYFLTAPLDELGLGDVEVRLLKTLIENYSGGPAGLATLANAVGETELDVKKVYEPYLMRIGFLQVSSSGRTVTEAAYKHLGYEYSK
jgi:Holliday junction DNA helicase RuvB